jgi:hypothetical protein
MSDNKEYICVSGLVQFEPTPRIAAGKDVRDVLLRVANAGGKQVGVTVWDSSHGHIPIKKGDYVVADGSYTQKPSQNKAGEPITYHNVSANMLLVIPVESGQNTKSSPAPSAAPAAAAAPVEDLPF